VCLVSERRACEVLGQPRSTQRYAATVKEDEPLLVSRILELVREFPRYGYRQITRLLRGEGWEVNFKRVYRLWKREGLRVPKKKKKLRRLGDSSGGITRRKAERINHVWSVDFIFDRTANGRSLKILSIIDEFTRECIALEVSRRLTSSDVTSVLVDLFAIRGVPEFIRSDNGPEFIAKRLRRFLESIDVGTSYIEPGSPWENGYVESFHSRLRDECLACEEFTTLAEAIQVIGQWRLTYNQRRPHSSLGGLTPAAFASQWTTSVPEQAPPAPALQRPIANPLTQPVPS
jgi:transposase InsO family protein